MRVKHLRRLVVQGLARDAVVAIAVSLRLCRDVGLRFTGSRCLRYHGSVLNSSIAFVPRWPVFCFSLSLPLPLCATSLSIPIQVTRGCRSLTTALKFLLYATPILLVRIQYLCRGFVAPVLVPIIPIARLIYITALARLDLFEITRHTLALAPISVLIIFVLSVSRFLVKGFTRRVSRIYRTYGWQCTWRDLTYIFTIPIPFAVPARPVTVFVVSAIPRLFVETFASAKCSSGSDTSWNDASREVTTFVELEFSVPLPPPPFAY